MRNGLELIVEHDSVLIIATGMELVTSKHMFALVMKVLLEMIVVVNKMDRLDYRRLKKDSVIKYKIDKEAVKKWENLTTNRF